MTLSSFHLLLYLFALFQFFLFSPDFPPRLHVQSISGHSPKLRCHNQQQGAAWDVSHQRGTSARSHHASAGGRFPRSASRWAPPRRDRGTRWQGRRSSPVPARQPPVPLPRCPARAVLPPAPLPALSDAEPDRRHQRCAGPDLSSLHRSSLHHKCIMTFFINTRYLQRDFFQINLMLHLQFNTNVIRSRLCTFNYYSL